jgi:hypothetical protein
LQFEANLGKQLARFYLEKNPSQKRAGGVTQGAGSEFKLQYCKKKRKGKRKRRGQKERTKKSKESVKNEGGSFKGRMLGNTDGEETEQKGPETFSPLILTVPCQTNAC